MTEETLRILSESRWFVPLLSAMHEGDGARFAMLAKRLDISNSALSRAIRRLEAHGWLGQNPGHGHPLRPEYILTASGRPIASWSARIMAERRRLGLEAGDLGRWTLPMLHSLADPKRESEWARFSALQVRLRPISPRALSLVLKQMLEKSLIQRRLEAAFPPLPLYGLTTRGRRLASAALRG